MGSDCSVQASPILDGGQQPGACARRGASARRLFTSIAFTSTSGSDGGGPVGGTRDLARCFPYSRGNVLQRSLRHGGLQKHVVHGYGHSVQPAVLQVVRNVPLERQMTDFVIHHQLRVQPLGNENIRKGNLLSSRPAGPREPKPLCRPVPTRTDSVRFYTIPTLFSTLGLR